MVGFEPTTHQRLTRTRGSSCVMRIRQDRFSTRWLITDYDTLAYCEEFVIPLLARTLRSTQFDRMD